MKWLLIIFIIKYPHSTIEAMTSISAETDSLEVCVSEGKRLSETFTIIKNKESDWTRQVIREAKYECVKISNKLKF